MSDWKETSLKEIFSVSSGEGLSESKLRPGSHPVYGGNGINGYHDSYLYEDSKLIIGRVGAHCGNIHLTESFNWITDNALFVTFLSKEQDVNFWYYKLSELRIRQYAFEGAQPVITGGTIGKIKLIIPTPKIQTKIAHILSTTDIVIEKTHAAIAKYKVIKQGMLHDLFTRGIDMSSTRPATANKLRPSYQEAPELYKESKLGWIPREWEVEPLEDLVDIDSEQLNSSTDFDFAFYYIDISSIETEQIIYPIHTIRFQVAPSRARRIIKFNDILMSTVRPNLKAFAHFKRKSNYQFIASTGFAVLSPKIRTDIDFVYQALFTNYFERQIDKYVVGSNYPAINSADLKILLVKTPKKLEQTEIAKRILSIDNKLQSEQTYLQKLQQIKKGLMEDLLSGRKRVKVEEIK